MISPKVSIIIPCYNQEAFLEKCLQSILKQSFTDWECLIVDDGSTDRTAEIALGFCEKSDQIKYLYKENGGLSSARNHGMNFATGKYIFFIDSDDSLTNDTSLQHFIAMSDEETDVITANIYLEDAEGNLKPSKLNVLSEENQIFAKNEVLDAYLDEKISTVAWNKLYSRAFLEKYNLKFKEGLLHEDELWSLQVYLKAEKVKTIPQFTYNYFKGNSGAITANKNRKNYDSFIYIMQQIVDIAKSDEKLNTADRKKVVRLFEKQYYFLKDKSVLSDKELWTEKYNEIRNIYRKSILNNYQKRFKYPASLSYLAAKEIYLKYTDLKFLSKLITF